jgi:hypothetical protein
MKALDQSNAAATAAVFLGLGLLPIDGIAGRNR